jgi:hypothetical protein
VTRELRKEHEVELHILISSEIIIILIKSSWMRLAGYVARIGADGKAYRLLARQQDGKKSQGIRRGGTLIWILENRLWLHPMD